MRQRVIRTGKRSKSQEGRKKRQQIQEQIGRLDSRYELIQMLIPLGLKAVEEELQREVEQLVGQGASRSPENRRWGKNPGSVYLGDQKVREVYLRPGWTRIDHYDYGYVWTSEVSSKERGCCKVGEVSLWRERKFAF